MTILSIDIGTTGMKMGIYHAHDEILTLQKQLSHEYSIHTYNNGIFSEIEPSKWQQAVIEGCANCQEFIREVDVVALSGTTPGLTAMDDNGNALYPAILMLDQRSRSQAQHIIQTIGLENLLEVTGNMPVAGGCSLASILWIRENHPDIFKKVRTFGHTNTFLAQWLTGKPAIDPSSASLTALYNLNKNNLTWNDDIAGAFKLSSDLLPQLMHSWESPGRVTSLRAKELGFKKEPPVVIGGNDAVLAAYSLGIREPGEIVNVNGTCEITLVCLPQCISSKKYNIRAHVIPGRWLTLYVMNAGGKALEWFRNLFVSEMDTETFYHDFLPHAVDTYIERESLVSYIPFLMGSRYSQVPLKAELHGLTPETTREEVLTAIVKGLCQYQREHLEDISKSVPLDTIIHVTGGAVNPSLIRAKRKWMRESDYVYEEQSSMKGAALLGKKYLEEYGN